MGKGPGKGNKSFNPIGGKGKEGKRGFQGKCLYCGVWGHRLNECRKKDADVAKGKGKAQGSMSDLGWKFPGLNKGKGEGKKGSWNGGKGSLGNGGKGAYSMEDDWSAGYSGYSFDIPVFSAHSPKKPRVSGKWQSQRRPTSLLLPPVTARRDVARP